MSWGFFEFSGETADDSHFTTPANHKGITFVAASGDETGLLGLLWPAASPYVLSVGGTTLKTKASGGYARETAWTLSTGGVSAYETEPPYQSSVQSTGSRVVPDVAYDADTNTGIAIYDSQTYQGQSGWFEAGGTSAGAPQWAALIALIDQGLSSGTLDGASQTLPDLYALAGTASYTTDFHDVTKGSNGAYAAGPGFDAVTGLGSPVANQLLQAAAGWTGTTAAAASPSTPPATLTARATGTPHVQVAPAVVASLTASPQVIVLDGGLAATTPPASAPVTTFSVAAPPAVAPAPIALARPIQPIHSPSADRDGHALSIDESSPGALEVRPPDGIADPGEIDIPLLFGNPPPAAPAVEAPPPGLAWDQPGADAGVAVLSGDRGVPWAGGVDTSSSPLRSALMAGLAVAFWRAGEARARQAEGRGRRQGRPDWVHPAPGA
jgi:hypothetical protein